MFDPQAAVFEGLTLMDDGVVCGRVNGKNQFGGYVGAQPFYYTTPESRARSEAQGRPAVNGILVASDRQTEYLVKLVCDRPPSLPRNGPTP